MVSSYEMQPYENFKIADLEELQIFGQMYQENLSSGLDRSRKYKGGVNCALTNDAECLGKLSKHPTSRSSHFFPTY